MKKTLYIIASVVLMITACTKDLEELNVDPKNPSTAPSYALFTNAQRALSNTVELLKYQPEHLQADRSALEYHSVSG
jgi:hypothetical protein